MCSPLAKLMKIILTLFYKGHIFPNALSHINTRDDTACTTINFKENLYISFCKFVN